MTKLSGALSRGHRRWPRQTAPQCGAAPASRGRDEREARGSQRAREAA